ncbi:unnamed protein product [Arctogadus glacialis]
MTAQSQLIGHSRQRVHRSGGANGEKSRAGRHASVQELMAPCFVWLTRQYLTSDGTLSFVPDLTRAVDVDEQPLTPWGATDACFGPAELRTPPKLWLLSSNQLLLLLREGAPTLCGFQRAQQSPCVDEPGPLSGRSKGTWLTHALEKCLKALSSTSARFSFLDPSSSPKPNAELFNPSTLPSYLRYRAAF